MAHAGTGAETTGAARHHYQSLGQPTLVVTLSEVAAADLERTPTGQPELVRLLGGGIARGRRGADRPVESTMKACSRR